MRQCSGRGSARAGGALAHPQATRAVRVAEAVARHAVVEARVLGAHLSQLERPLRACNAQAQRLRSAVSEGHVDVECGECAVE